MINPYISSLQRYETVLTGTDVPAAARTSCRQLSASLVARDMQFLSTINGLPPLRLGSYLERVRHEMPHNS